jgi:hypothetical protein
MMMTDRDMDELDALFAAARSHRVAVDGDLMARVLADAAAAQPLVASPRARVSSRDRLTRALQDLLGGWRPLGGMVAAGLAGLWVGLAPPAGIEGLAARMIGTNQSVILLPEADLSFLEEPTDG